MNSNKYNMYTIRKSGGLRWQDITGKIDLFSINPDYMKNVHVAIDTNSNYACVLFQVGNVWNKEHDNKIAANSVFSSIQLLVWLGQVKPYMQDDCMRIIKRVIQLNS